MPLAPGTKLGPYEIQSPLGAGGMGEVYRARDTRLGRDVAIKILPKEMSADAVRKQRFEREAKTISGLNHPNICVLHDVGCQDSVDYLVMECVEGETLAKRLEKGPLALDQVLKYGAQIAGALDRAHQSGVVHRDLKPGNIMLTHAGAKLLDFGLAKPVTTIASLATLTTAVAQSPATQEGTIVGTFQYMSPEQVEGKEVDGRSDIFSLGAVLYEMLTGKKAFDGKSQLSVASAILEKEPPPIGAIKPLTPPALDHTVKKCLSKDVRERWQSAADIKHELEWIAQGSGESSAGAAVRPGRTVQRRAVGLALGALALIAMGAAANFLLRREGPSGPITRTTLTMPANVSLLTMGDQAGAPVISRDGNNLVFVGTSEGKQMLFLRPMDGTAAKPLRGTENGKFPFWSSDGKSIGFFADQQLKRVDLAGGPPISLAPAEDARGGSWAGKSILYTPYIYGVIYRVPSSGGKPIPVTKMDASQHTTHRWPQFLPDGEHFLYLAASHMNGSGKNAAIYVGSIDGASGKQILQTNTNALYASGNLLYYSEGSLMFQVFDAKRLELGGAASPIDSVLRESGNWGMIASASENGVLVFQSAGEAKYPIVWLDRSGHASGPPPFSLELLDLRLSPDRTRAAIVGFGEGVPRGVAYVCDLKTGARTRLTFEEDAWFVVWSPEGGRIAYSVQQPGAENTEIYVKRSDGSGEGELLLSSGQLDHPTDWTREGPYISFNRGRVGAQQIWILPLSGERKAFRLFPNAKYEHFDGRISPNGKWIAYVSAESGHGEIYVTSFPRGIGKWQITSGGGNPAAIWRPDGKELYYVSQEGMLMAASIHESAGSITLEGVHPLFRSPFLNSPLRAIFDVGSTDGQRFIGSAGADTSALPLNVITNWTAGLPKK